MTRFITYLTLIPSIFTFVAIILINVGGVNPESGSKNQSMEEKNPQFSLLTWDYTVNSQQVSSTRNSYHLFLNRICVGSGTTVRSKYSPVFRCRNDRFPRLRDGSRLSSTYLGSRSVSPFRFDTVNMDVVLAFYIISELLVLPLMFMALAGANSKRRRGIRGAAALCTGVALVCMIIASSVLTAQMVHLRNQIRDDTMPTVRVSSPYRAGGADLWRINVTDVSLGKTFLGLSWAAVFALMVDFGIWMWAFLAVKNDAPPAYEMKHQQDGCVHD